MGYVQKVHAITYGEVAGVICGYYAVVSLFTLPIDIAYSETLKIDIAFKLGLPLMTYGSAWLLNRSVKESESFHKDFKDGLTGGASLAGSQIKYLVAAMAVIMPIAVIAGAVNVAIW